MSQAMAIVSAGMGLRLKAPQKRPPTLAGGGLNRTPVLNLYFLTWYTRSPASVFVDSILRPCFLAAVERKPRTLWACQSVAFWISARLAPLGRPISSRIFAPLLSARGVPASLVRAGLAAFLPTLAFLSYSARPWLCPWRLSDPRARPS